MITAIKRTLSAVCLLGTCTAVHADSATQTVDPALVVALKQAVDNVNDIPEQLDTMLWLAKMSQRLNTQIKDPFYRVYLLRMIHEEATRADLDPELVLAVIQVESRFDRFAVSSSGARGLMQIMPFWKKEIGHPDDDLFNPRTNLRYGCAILRYYLDQTPGRVSDALAAYNGSIGNTDYADRVNLALRDRWQPLVTD
jgi:soluble lytic murein transglycosylase-like protein